MANSISSEDGDLGFQIAPMVDIVFVLLLFFMASVGYKLVEKELSIKVPGPTVTSCSLSTPIFIDIAADNSISVNNEVYATGNQKDLSRLSGWLRQIAADFGNDPVILRPKSNTRHERIIDVLNACVAAKVKNVSFN